MKKILLNNRCPLMQALFTANYRLHKIYLNTMKLNKASWNISNSQNIEMWWEYIYGWCLVKFHFFARLFVSTVAEMAIQGDLFCTQLPIFHRTVQASRSAVLIYRRRGMRAGQQSCEMSQIWPTLFDKMFSLSPQTVAMYLNFIQYKY